MAAGEVSVQPRIYFRPDNGDAAFIAALTGIVPFDGVTGWLTSKLAVEIVRRIPLTTALTANAKERR